MDEVPGTQAETTQTEAGHPAVVAQTPPAAPAHDGQRPPGGYTQTQRRLHWGVAALVIIQILGGIVVAAVLAKSAPGSRPAALIIHGLLGTVIFFLVAARLRLRQQVGAPNPPEGTPQDAALLARLNHYGFYVLLLALPVLGWLAFFAPRPNHSFWGAVHVAFAFTLILAICLHLAGSAYHTYVRRDGLLRRMTDVKLPGVS